MQNALCFQNGKKMEIKGTAVKSTIQFIQEKFPGRYDEWVKSLPKEIALYFEDGVMVANWYPLIESVIIPTKKIAELFYNSDYKAAAYDIGYFSAMQALGGVYQIFVKIASVDFVLKRAATIFSTYYKTGVLEVEENINKEKFILALKGFQTGDEGIFDRVAGWIKGIFEIIAKGKYNVTYTFNDNGKKFLDCKILVFKE